MLEKQDCSRQMANMERNGEEGGRMLGAHAEKKRAWERGITIR